MSYSSIHLNFVQRITDQAALTSPQLFLGENYETILNFWKYIDSLNEEQWAIDDRRYVELVDNRTSAANAARNAVNRCCTAACWDAAWDVARGPAKRFASGSNVIPSQYASAYATWELIGMHILLNQGKKLVFVLLFDSL